MRDVTAIGSSGAQRPPGPRPPGPRRVHLTGASGSGTTTLGRALASRLGLAHLDTDDFYWQPTDPPYQTKRPMPDRLARLEAALDAAATAQGGWVLSGSLVGWGDPLMPRFQTVVFLAVPTAERLRRIELRERMRYGDAIEPGGSRHAESQAFLRWAAQYDDGDHTMRSRARHDLWLKHVPCPVARFEDLDPVERRLERLLAFWGLPIEVGA